MPFTYEFYCNPSTGSNLNSGTTESTTPILENIGGSWNGTSVFTCAGSPDLSVVPVNGIVSIYVAGTTATGFLARVTAVDNGAKTITVSTTYRAGSVPGAGTYTLRYGGCWQGPNGSSGFPFSAFDLSALPAYVAANNATSEGNVRVNLKNNATYSLTAAIAAQTGNRAGVRWQGYSTTVGDGGKATFSGGTSGASFQLISQISSQELVDLCFDGNGGTGSATGVNINGTRNMLRRVVVKNMRGYGIDISGTAILDEVEAYANGVAGTFAGIRSTNGFLFNRVISNGNLGTSYGILGSGTGDALCILRNCITARNGNSGIHHGANAGLVLIQGCDSWNNSGAGLYLQHNGTSRSAVMKVENCNFLKNTGWGLQFDYHNGAPPYLAVHNCGFGAGTQANGSGTYTIPNSHSSEVSGIVTYPSNTTPWNDPTNGDFRITHASAKNTGRGAFTQTESGQSGTVGYPDIGAAQSQASGGGVRTVTWSGGYEG